MRVLTTAIEGRAKYFVRRGQWFERLYTGRRDSDGTCACTIPYAVFTPQTASPWLDPLIAPEPDIESRTNARRWFIFSPILRHQFSGSIASLLFSEMFSFERCCVSGRSQSSATTVLIAILGELCLRESPGRKAADWFPSSRNEDSGPVVFKS